LPYILRVIVVSLFQHNELKVRSPEATDAGKLTKKRSEMAILGNTPEIPSLIIS
jgi:hypothetical protein